MSDGERGSKKYNKPYENVLNVCVQRLQVLFYYLAYGCMALPLLHFHTAREQEYNAAVNVTQKFIILSIK